MNNDILLLPMPRHIDRYEGTTTLPADALIVIPDASLFAVAQQAQTALAGVGVGWEIVAGADYADTGLSLSLDPAMMRPQHYRLTVSPGRIDIIAADAAGVFYGVCTLRQLLRDYQGHLPLLRIDDYPDFARRGVMLDISRDRVPTMETLYDLVDTLASWKINEVQLYTEHTFAYRAHQEVWAEASPLTGEETLALDAYCRERYIDLVPNQNSLGHMERWLKFPRYLPLAEKPEGFIAPWGEPFPPTTLDPQDPGSIALIAGLYDELLPHFTSSLFNVGGDEPWELGQGKSKEAVEARGGRVYLDYLLKLHKDVTQRGRRMMFWADIIMHHPELVPELPQDLIALEWGYEATHDFDGHCATLAAAGGDFYVCPGTSSWNAIIGRTDNMIGNIRSAAEAGLKHSAIGLLNTDWGDRGHWQPLPVSYAGYAYGAAVSWCYDSNYEIDLAAALDAFAFLDDTGVMGQAVLDLGNVYRITGPDHINGGMLAYLLQSPVQEIDATLERLTGWNKGKPIKSDFDTLQTVITRIDELLAQIDDAPMRRPDAELVKQEFRQAGELIRYSARRLLYAKGNKDFFSADELSRALDTLIDRQRQLWLARSKPGGLDDSLERFEKARPE